jgi:hypothetical protein
VHEVALSLARGEWEYARWGMPFAGGGGGGREEGRGRGSGDGEGKGAGAGAELWAVLRDER